MEFKNQRSMLIRALERYVSRDHLENVADVFLDFVFSEF